MRKSDDQMSAKQSYVLGYSERELVRLERQASLFADVTRDLLSRAGISHGMRVLDVGCGVGDVSSIAAELVGSEGDVLGLDPSDEALAIAEARLHAAGKNWVRFEAATVEGFTDYHAFDAVIGRFILIHLEDPAATVRSMVQELRPGAVVVFLEMDLSTAAAIPELPLLRRCLGWIVEVYRRTGRQSDMGTQLFATFRAAGLDPHMLALTRITNGADQPGFDFVVESVRSLMPAMDKLGIASANDIEIETLGERLSTEAGGEDRCIFYPRLVGAWATVK